MKEIILYSINILMAINFSMNLFRAFSYVKKKRLAATVIDTDLQKANITKSHETSSICRKPFYTSYNGLIVLSTKAI
jgi:hypothetical protein